MAVTSITMYSCTHAGVIRPYDHVIEARRRNPIVSLDRIDRRRRSKLCLSNVQAMSSIPHPDNGQAEIDRLVAELEKAEAYEVRLRQCFVDIKAQLAAGHTANAMSMLNEALRFIDDATDVVAPHQQP
jgi:hypothetical protein